MFYLCPRCYGIPGITFLENISHIRIHLTCLCGYNVKLPIISFLSLMRKYQKIFTFCSHKDHSIIATSMCSFCNTNLCVHCTNEHIQAQICSNNYSSIKQILFKVPTYCSKHQYNQYDYFCNDCKEPLCLSCTNENHFLHDLINLKEYKKKIDINKIIEKKNLAMDFLNKIEVLQIRELAQEIILKKNLLTIIETLINNYVSLPDLNNYFLVDNILKINFQEIEENFNINDKNAIISLFTNYKIIEMIKDNQINYFEIKNISLYNELGKDFIFCGMVVENDIIIGTFKGKLLVYSLITSLELLEIPDAHENSIYYLCQLPMRKVASSSKDLLIKIWSYVDHILICEKLIISHTDHVYKLIQISDTLFASCSKDCTIKIWMSVEPYDEIMTLNGHSNDVSSILKLKWKNVLVSGSLDKTINFWDLNNYKIIKTIGDVFCSYLNNLYEIDKRRIIVGCHDMEKGFIIINTSTYQIESIISAPSLLFLNNPCFFMVFSFLKLNDDFIICGVPSKNILALNIKNLKFYTTPKATNILLKSVGFSSKKTQIYFIEKYQNSFVLPFSRSFKIWEYSYFQTNLNAKLKEI